MADNVAYLPVPDGMDIDPNRVLTGAVDQLATVVVVGITPDGEEYLASSTGDGRTLLWLLTRASMYVAQGGSE